MKRIRIAILTLLALILISCVYYQYPISQYRYLDMSLISIGDSKQTVYNILGEPAKLLGATTSSDGSVIEVVEYMEAQLGVTQDYLMKDYYLYFKDGILVQWGRPGDWKKEADLIIEHRY